MRLSEIQPGYRIPRAPVDPRKDPRYRDATYPSDEGYGDPNYSNQGVQVHADRLRLVRAQPDLQGIGRDEGGIYIYRYNKAQRNTVHFTINGIVSSHLGGNWDKAGVVIIVDIRNVEGHPVKVNLVDTYYHLDQQGKLYLKNPVIFAKPGIANPLNLPVITNTTDNKTAVENYLENQGIHPLQIGNHYPINYSVGNRQKEKEIADKYGIPGETGLGLHAGSYESVLETYMLKDFNEAIALLKQAQQGQNTTGEARKIAQRAIKDAEEYMQKYPQFGQRASAYLNRIKTSFQRIIALADSLDKKKSLR
jgi:hypothetical protein